MNRLLTKRGGQDVRLNDLKFIEQSVYDVLHALAESFCHLPNSDTYGFLLSGSITYEGDVAEVVNAYVYFKKEIFFVPSQTVQAPSVDYPGWYFRIEETEAKSRIFLDGSEKNIYAMRNLAMAGWNFYQYSDPGGIFLNLSNIKKPENYYMFKEASAGWAMPGVGAGWEEDPTNRVRYRRNNIGNVELLGRLKKTTANPSSTIYTLALNFRPAKSQTFIIGSRNNMGATNSTISITAQANGAITVSTYDNLVDDYYEICHTIFLE